MLGAFSIDAYLPSFGDIGRSPQVDREHFQQRLSIFSGKELLALRPEVQLVSPAIARLLGDLKE